jgi:hypothetical protein
MIKLKTALLICCGLALAACESKDTKPVEIPKDPTVDGAPDAPQTGVSARNMGNYSKDMASYAQLSVGETMESAVAKIKTHLTPEGEGNMSVTWETLDAGDGVQTFSGLASEMPDDSVRSQEFLAVFKKDGEGVYRLVDYGARVKCWRGDDPGKWTVKLCP